MSMRYADLAIGDRVQLRKSHPCGSTDWVVYRLGADVGLKCVGCDRRILLSRAEIERRVKHVVSRAEEARPSTE